MRIVLTAMLAAMLLSAPSGSAPPGVPHSVSYQGVLLDDQGTPRSGSVDLTLRIYDSAISGTLLYKQEFFGTPLVEGVFHLRLGPTGTAADLPVDPLTVSLSTALAGDLAAVGPDRFLDLTVGAESPLARTQLLSTPFALRAETAESSDTALSVQTFGGLPETVFTQIFEHVNLDGTGPGNNAASEGLGDTDGDGLANFVDPDNDNDGIDDGTEVAQGSDINLTTPSISTLTPDSASELQPVHVVVQGAQFDPAMTVAFGSESPAPLNLTPTSFEVDLLGQPAGSAPVVVTLPNGQSGTANFSWGLVTPTIASFTPPTSLELTPATILVLGTNFQPGMTVAFGTENPVPMNLTPTSFEVTLAGTQQDGGTPVIVTLSSGQSTQAQYPLLRVVPDVTQINPASAPAGTAVSIVVEGSSFRPDLNPVITFGTDSPTPTLVQDDRIEFDAAGQPTGVAPVTVTLSNGENDSANFIFSDQLTTPIDATGAHITFSLNAGKLAVGGRDAYGDQSQLFAFPSYGDVDPGQLAVAIDNAGTLFGLRCAETGPTSCNVELYRDDDGDFDLEASEVVTILESLTTSPVGIFAPNIVFDSANRIALGYKVEAGEDAYRIAYDRTGDGAFFSPQEFVSLPDAGGGPSEAKLTLDSSDRVAVAFRSASAAVDHVYYDRNGDGDFDDLVSGVPESTDVGGTLGFCASPAFGAGGHLSLLGRRRLLTDTNDDGDFDDAGEDVTLFSGGSSGCDMVTNSAGGLALAVIGSSNDIRLFNDENADGDFLDPDEDRTIAGSGGRLAIAADSSDPAIAFGGVGFIELRF